MWKYQSPEELYHAGVLGMKWGHRKTPTRSQVNKANFKAAKKRINERWNKSFDKAVGNQNLGQLSENKKSMASINKAAAKTKLDMKKAKEAYKAEKRAIRGDVKAAARRQRDSASLGEKLLYNDATRRRAGKLMVERKMSEAKAVSKAKKEAWRNTGIAAVGLIGLGALSAYGNR